MQATHGDGRGWVRLAHQDWPGHIYLRLEPDSTGRWRVMDLVMRGEWRHIVGADLRELNLSAIEEWLQHDADLLSGFGIADLDLSEVFSFFGSPAKPPKRVPRLQRPTNGLTDDFLRHVAAAYRQAVMDGKAPAPDLAKQLGDGSTARTIHKWVLTARQRGIMPPAARRRAAD